jgi:hypothetical protein
MKLVRLELSIYAPWTMCAIFEARPKFHACLPLALSPLMLMGRSIGRESKSGRRQKPDQPTNLSIYICLNYGLGVLPGIGFSTSCLSFPMTATFLTMAMKEGLSLIRALKRDESCATVVPSGGIAARTSASVGGPRPTVYVRDYYRVVLNRVHSYNKLTV